MPPRITLVFLIAAFGLAGFAAEPSPPAGKDDSGLGFRVLAVPITVFCNFDLSNRDGAPSPKPGVVPIKNSGGEYYDITEFLMRYGVTFPPGSAAVYDGALIVRDTAPNLRLIDQIFGKPHSDDLGHLSIEVSEYECAFPPSDGLMPWNGLTFFALRKLPPGSLKLLDFASIETKSGQRAVADHAANPDLPNGAKNDNGGGVLQPGGTGTHLEVEPVVGPDGVTVDVNLDCRIRAKLENGSGSEITDTDCVTSFTLWGDCPAVIHVTPVPNQPGKYIVMVAEAGMKGRSVGWNLPEPKFPLRHAVAAKGGKASPRMILKVYKVPPGFLSVSQQAAPLLLAPGSAPQPAPAGPRKPMDAMQFLKDSGVTFPPGSTAFFDDTTGTLIILDTAENIDLVDQIVESINNTSPCMAMADLAAYECKFTGTQKPPQADKFTYSDLEHLRRDSVKLLGCASVITISGQRMVASDVTSSSPANDTHVLEQQGALQFQAGETGTKIRVEPVIGPDGKTIDAEVEYLLRFGKEGNGGGEIPEIKGYAKFTAQSGMPQVIQMTPVKNQNGTYIVVVIRMRIVNPGGWSSQGPDKPVPRILPQAGEAALAPPGNQPPSQ